MLSILAHLSSIVSTILAFIAVRGKTSETKLIGPENNQVQVEELTNKGKVVITLAILTFVLAVATQYTKDEQDKEKSKVAAIRLAHQLYLADSQLEVSSQALNKTNEIIGELQRTGTWLNRSNLEFKATLYAGNESSKSEIRKLGLNPELVTYVGDEYIKQRVGYLKCVVWVNDVFTSAPLDGVLAELHCVISASVVAEGFDDTTNKMYRGLRLILDGTGGVDLSKANTETMPLGELKELMKQRPTRISLFDLETKPLTVDFIDIDVREPLRTYLLENDGFTFEISRGDRVLSAYIKLRKVLGERPIASHPGFEGTFEKVE